MAATLIMKVGTSDIHVLTITEICVTLRLKTVKNHFSRKHVSQKFKNSKN